MVECKFCTIIASGVVWRHKSVCAFMDNYPVTKGHWLVVPVEHRADFFDMSPIEMRDAGSALTHLRETVLAGDDSVTGFNIGWNCGTSAGQTIGHAHAHLIPRRDGDVADPTGGVRGVIPDRRRY